MFGLASASSVRQLENDLNRLRTAFETYVASDAARIAASVNASAQLRTAAARIERATDRAAERERKQRPPVTEEEQEELVEAGSFRELIERELSLTDEDDDDGEAQG